jgi:uncharacterized membrane protein
MFLFKRPKWNEKTYRSFFKTLSWRIIATLSNFVGAWWTSGSWQVGLSFAGFALVMNSILYYFHERIWNKADWAKEATKE